MTSIEKPENILSLDLWTSSKVIGRECSTINKDYFVCKKNLGEDPANCESNARQVLDCSLRIVNLLNGSFPKEFSQFKKCLDENDYRFKDCRQYEKNLLECWNTKFSSDKNI